MVRAGAGMPRQSNLEELISFVLSSMQDYIESHPQDSYARASCPYDVKRLAVSLQWIEEVGIEAGEVLELGSFGVASSVIERRLPSNRYTRTSSDLREPLPYPDAAFELVVSMEVIEHICDLEYAQATVLSGVKHSLRESYRVLRPGGRLFLTTPNACSLLVLGRALAGEPPWQYPFHFREFSPFEIQALCEEAGFTIARFATEYVWSSPTDFEVLGRLVRGAGFTLDDRGDDMFLVGEKTSLRPTPRGTLAVPSPR